MNACGDSRLRGLRSRKPIGFRQWVVHEFKEFASSFLSDVVNFIFMAFVLFCLLKAINKLTSIGHKVEEPKAPTTKKCPFCKTEIDIEATRCPHCTSVLEEAKKD